MLSASQPYLLNRTQVLRPASTLSRQPVRFERRYPCALSEQPTGASSTETHHKEQRDNRDNGPNRENGPRPGRAYVFATTPPAARPCPGPFSYRPSVPLISSALSNDANIPTTEQIKDTIQSLFQLLVQVSTYDQAGRATQPVLAAELTTLSQSLRAVHNTAASSLRPRSNTTTTTTNPPTTLPDIPDPLIEYVEAGRNPDIYTREFVELVRRMNQLARGKEMAFVRFRDVLAGEMATAMPEVAADVERVVEATGGREPIPPVGDAGKEGVDGSGVAASGAGSGGEGEDKKGT